MINNWFLFINFPFKCGWIICIDQCVRSCRRKASGSSWTTVSTTHIEAWSCPWISWWYHAFICFLLVRLHTHVVFPKLRPSDRLGNRDTRSIEQQIHMSCWSYQLLAFREAWKFNCFKRGLLLKWRGNTWCTVPGSAVLYTVRMWQSEQSVFGQNFLDLVLMKNNIIYHYS